VKRQSGSIAAGQAVIAIAQSGPSAKIGNASAAAHATIVLLPHPEAALCREALMAITHPVSVALDHPLCLRRKEGYANSTK
jgi:hypothetical protein